MSQVEHTYKSPQRKLVKFFQQSRDRWKAKHHEGCNPLSALFQATIGR